MRYRPNERAGGTGGFASLFHTVHSWSALPQHGAFRKHLRMYLNKQELLLLKFYQKYRSKDPTLPSLLMRPLLNLVVLLGVCLGIWLLATAPGGSREWGCGRLCEKFLTGKRWMSWFSKGKTRLANDPSSQRRGAAGRPP